MTKGGGKYSMSMIIDFLLFAVSGTRIDTHKFHSWKQCATRPFRIIVGRSRPKHWQGPTIKIFYCTARSPLLFGTAPKADNRWHNKCNKSTQSVPFPRYLLQALLTTLTRTRRAMLLKMISVFALCGKKVPRSPLCRIQIESKVDINNNAGVESNSRSLFCTRSTD